MLINQKNTLLIIGLAAFLLCSCKVHIKDHVWADPGSPLITIYASKERTLLEANKLNPDSISQIILWLNKAEKMDLSLMNKALRNKVTIIADMSYYKQSPFIHLRYFPKVESITYSVPKRSPAVSIDTSLQYFTHLVNLKIGADSVYITNIPAQIRSLSVYSDYLSFPYIPERNYNSLDFRSLTMDIDFRNFRNLDDSAFFHLSSLIAIPLDSIYGNLKCSLKYMDLISIYKANTSSKIISDVPYTKNLRLTDTYLTDSVQPLFNAQVAYIYLAKRSERTTNKGDHKGYFSSDPKLTIIKLNRRLRKKSFRYQL